MPEEDKFRAPEYGIRQVKKGAYAYHTHPDISYAIIEKLFDNREICELTEVYIYRSFTTFAVNYNSSFFEISKVG